MGVLQAWPRLGASLVQVQRSNCSATLRIMIHIKKLLIIDFSFIEQNSVMVCEVPRVALEK